MDAHLRERKLAAELDHARAALNAAIYNAHAFGLKIEVSVETRSSMSSHHEMPSVTTRVYKEL